jgi:hypothetical protein
MTRPLLEVADIVRSQGDRFMQHNFRGIQASKPTPRLSENHWKATGGPSLCLPSVNHVICTASISNRS